MKSYDTVIVGAGLAGMQCAHLLGARGLRVLLVDRKKSLGDAVHTTGIFVRRTLEDFDLPVDCLGPAVRRVVLYSPARRALTLTSRHDEFRVGRMDALYANYLARCERAGVTWSPDTRFIGAQQEGARQNTVLDLNVGGRAERIKTRFLVGADGARSQVARTLALDENTGWIVGCEEIWRDAVHDGPPTFHCFLDSQLAPGYLAWVVADGEETHIGVGGYAARFAPLAALETFRNSLSRIIDLRLARLVERRGGRIPVGGVLRRIVNSQGLLTGDAAGAVSPLTAGGLDPCLRLSGLAARVIEAYLETGDAAALAPYAGTRFRARFVSRLWMRRVMDGARSRSQLEMMCALLRTPFLRPLAAHVFFGRGSFPDVPATIPLEIPA